MSEEYELRFEALKTMLKGMGFEKNEGLWRCSRSPYVTFEDRQIAELSRSSIPVERVLRILWQDCLNQERSAGFTAVDLRNEKPANPKADAISSYKEKKHAKRA